MFIPPESMPSNKQKFEPLCKCHFFKIPTFEDCLKLAMSMDQLGPNAPIRHLQKFVNDMQDRLVTENTTFNPSCEKCKEYTNFQEIVFDGLPDNRGKIWQTPWNQVPKTTRDYWISLFGPGIKDYANYLYYFDEDNLRTLRYLRKKIQKKMGNNFDHRKHNKINDRYYRDKYAMN